MQNAIHEKTEEGYILRQRTASAIVVVVCIICFGLILLFEVLSKWTAEESSNIWIVAGLFLACLAIAIAVLRAECGYMVVTDKGIYFHRPLARAKFIAWEDVRDWGIAHQRTRYCKVYNLYFSTKVLMPARAGKNKKIPITHKETIYIAIEVNDLSSLQRTGVISFCRQQLREDNKMFVPMFISDLAENYTF